MSIQQINSGSTQGYQVRVGPRHASMTKFFAVRKYGGQRKALAQAKAAEVQMQKVALPITSRSGARLVAQANNTSGLVGIRPRYELFSEHPYLYFVASWSKNGKACSTSFSAEKHGKIGALQLAMERREKATGVRYSVSPRQAWNRMKHLIETP
jgi:AP2 domain